MGWPRSGSPEIRSQNLMHDHQVFQGITKECCEANPRVATLCSVADVRWLPNVTGSQVVSSPVPPVNGSQNNRWLNNHYRLPKQPSAEATWQIIHRLRSQRLAAVSSRVPPKSTSSVSVLGQTMVRVETILKHAEDTCKIETFRPLVPACQLKITSNFSEQTTKARQMNLRSNSFWTGRRPTAMWLLIPWTQETQETQPFGAMVIVDSSIQIISGWWFGTFFIFPHIGNNHANWRTHIFQMGRSTTNQIWWLPLDFHTHPLQGQQGQPGFWRHLMCFWVRRIFCLVTLW